MKEGALMTLHPYKVKKNSPNGYMMHWYTGGRDGLSVPSIHINESVMENAVKKASNGFVGGGLELPHFHIWKPAIVPGDHTSYLFDGCVVVYHTPRIPRLSITTNLPDTVLTLITQIGKKGDEESHLRDVIGTLGLPLEDMVVDDRKVS
jgi:hypothetical protein